MSDLDPLQMDERLGAAQRGVPNPVALSRQFAAADDVYRQWRERLRDDSECEDTPLGAHRALLGRTLFRDLDQLGDGDPLRVYLKRWLWCLAERRVNAAVLRRASFERYHQPLPTPVAAGSKETGPSTLAGLLLGALQEPTNAAPRLESYLQHSHSFARMSALLWERRAELARRWDLVGYDPILTVEPGESSEPSLADRARVWLERTQDMAAEYRRDSPALWIDQALARDAQLDWPGRLNWRVLSEWFLSGELLASLRLQSKRLPERIAPASFWRGLARLGEEWSQALAPADQFFVVAHDPFRVRAQAHAALFANLLLNTDFLRRSLAADPIRLRDARRPLFRALLLESRTRAFKVLMADAARQGWSALQEASMSETSKRFGFQLPAPAVGALFNAKDDCAAAFVGLMLAATQDDTLATSHDEDWFRNPRGIDQLRSEAALPPGLSLDQGSFARGADLLYAKLAATLG